MAVVREKVQEWMGKWKDPERKLYLGTIQDMPIARTKL
jgi:hypothetical protein